MVSFQKEISMGKDGKTQGIMQVNRIKKSARQLAEEKKIAALKPTQFKPGQSGNPTGNPKGSAKWTKTILKDIERCWQQAITKVEKQKNVSLLEHYIERALSSDKVLTAVANKVLPDLIHVEDTGSGGTRVYILQPIDKKGNPLAPAPSVIVNGSRINGVHSNGEKPSK